MTIWFRQSVPRSARGTTHALIIGTSFYRHLPDGSDPRGHTTFGLKQARTPCAGAMAFARWLRDEYRNPDAPVGSIRLLLAPSEEERADPELGAAANAGVQPTRENVENALVAWRKECDGDPDGVAILYISGHGLQSGRDVAVVLLTDFAATPNVMSFAVDVGLVRHGMAGHNRPQQQYFFVDACRIAPKELEEWEEMGNPLGLNFTHKGADYRSAPIFFSSSPDTPAFGKKGEGTVFSRGLLEVLSGPAAENGPDDHGRWYVTPYSLYLALNQRVTQLAAKLGRRQDAVLGGTPKDSVFHVFDSPPSVSFTLELDPEDAHAHAFADLWDGGRSTVVFQDQRFLTKLLQRQVPAGLYSVDVRIRPPTTPYVDRSGLSWYGIPRIVRPLTVKVI